MKRILLVEDEEHLAINLEFNLLEEGYKVDVAESLAQARSHRTSQRHDLIILDVMLPDGLGTDLCQELRDNGDLTPILMLTAKGTSEDIVTGLESGADDYMTKPFSLMELLGRIKAMLRRQTWDQPPPEAQQKIFHFQNHSINFDTHEVLAHGSPITLTALELRLLRFFVDHENQVVSREALLEEVWGLSKNTNTRTVDNFLVRLRRLFEEDPSNPQHFQTVRGIGYRFRSS